MELILLEKIRNLGELGDKVTVKPGYGRNFLIPQGKAVRATHSNLAEFEARRAELESKAQEVLAQANARAEALKELSLTIAAKASDEGKLFGSVGTREIAQAATDAGKMIENNEISMPNGVIREVGEFSIDVHLHSDVMTQITVVVVADK